MSAGVITGIFAVAAKTSLTIATGVITVTQGLHDVAPETTTTDDLDTINLDSSLSAALGTYRPLVILLGTSGNTITVKNGTGNIQLNAGADFTLGATDALMLLYDGTNWHDLGA